MSVAALGGIAQSSTDDRIAFGLSFNYPWGDGGWITTRGGAGSTYADNFMEKYWFHAGFWGNVRLAAGDVDGDGLDEMVVGLQSGGHGNIMIKDDAPNGHQRRGGFILPWEAYNWANGEVWPAAGDIDNDGRAEIVAGLGSGSEGWFAIFDDYAAGYALIGWRQVAWPTYNAAVGHSYPAVGNVDGIPGDEIIIGLGPGSNGWIEVFSSSASDYSHLAWMQVPWASYNTANGETHVAAGDLDADGRAEIVAGLGVGGGGWLHIFDDATADYASLVWRRTSWPLYNDDASLGETHPAVGDVDGDAGAEIVLGLGRFPGAGGWFEVLDDNAADNRTLAWRNVGWPLFTTRGGELYPAVGRFR